MLIDFHSQKTSTIFKKQSANVHRTQQLIFQITLQISEIIKINIHHYYFKFLRFRPSEFSTISLKACETIFYFEKLGSIFSPFYFRVIHLLLSSTQFFGDKRISYEYILLQFHFVTHTLKNPFTKFYEWEHTTSVFSTWLLPSAMRI